MLLPVPSTRGPQGDPGYVGSLYFWALHAVTQQRYYLGAGSQVGHKSFLITTFAVLESPGSRRAIQNAQSAA
jgi:hypothetical protein